MPTFGEKAAKITHQAGRDILPLKILKYFWPNFPKLNIVSFRNNLNVKMVFVWDAAVARTLNFVKNI